MSMLAKSPRLNKLDPFWQATIIRFLPNWIKPSHLTALRLVLIPITVWLLVYNYFSWALIIFLVGAILDGLDGALARQKNLTSKAGAIIDPMIDKFLYVGCLIVLLFKYAYWPLLAFSMTVDFLILLIALFVILAGRKNKLIAADKIGKVKMFFQILTLVTILFSLIFSTNWLLTLSLIILLVSISLQLISSLNYLIKFIIS